MMWYKHFVMADYSMKFMTLVILYGRKVNNAKLQIAVAKNEYYILLNFEIQCIPVFANAINVH